MDLRVDDSQSSLGGGEDQGFPFDFCSSIGSFPTPDKIPHDPSNLATHGQVRVPSRRHVPHGGKKHLICYEDSPYQRESASAPIN